MDWRVIQVVTMKNLISFCHLLAIVTLCGCSSMKTNISYDAKASFTGLKTYAWIPYPAEQRADVRLNYDFLDKTIHASLNTELNKKGIAQTSDNQPDFRIRWYVAINEEATDTQITTYAGGFAGASGWGYDPNGQWTYATPMYQSYQRTYTVGSLVIDFLNAKTGHLIWRGAVNTVVNPSAAPEQRKQKINQAIQQLIMEFPPKAK